MTASIEVIALDAFIPQIFEVRIVTFRCVNNTTIDTLTVWYKNNEMINNGTATNLTLTFKSINIGFYKCGINGTNSTNEFNVTVKNMYKFGFSEEIIDII